MTTPSTYSHRTGDGIDDAGLAGFTGVFPAAETDAEGGGFTPPSHLVGQFHGILTGQSSPTWPIFGTVYFTERHPGVSTVNSHYFALPLPRIEALRNPGRSRSLVREMLVAAGTLGPRTPISIVSHSNGAVLSLQVARELIARGVPLRSLVMIAPAVRTRSASREVAAWLDSGMLEYVLLVRPTRDKLIGAIGHNWRTRLYAWPWGSLGSDGWDLAEIEHIFPNIPATVDIPDMGHSDPVAPSNREWLYREIISPALGLAPWIHIEPRGGMEA